MEHPYVMSMDSLHRQRAAELQRRAEDRNRRPPARGQRPKRRA